MKTIIKLLGIAALVAVTGFGMISCGGGGGDSGPGIPSVPALDLDDISDVNYYIAPGANVPDTSSEATTVFDTVSSVLNSSYSRLEDDLEYYVSSRMGYGNSVDVNLATVPYYEYSDSGVSNLTGNAKASYNSTQTSFNMNANGKASFQYDSRADSSASYQLNYGADWIRAKANVSFSQTDSQDRNGEREENEQAMIYAGAFSIGQYQGKFIFKAGAAYALKNTTNGYYDDVLESVPKVSGSIAFYDNAGVEKFYHPFTDEELMELFGLDEYGYETPGNNNPINPGGGSGGNIVGAWYYGSSQSGGVPAYEFTNSGKLLVGGQDAAGFTYTANNGTVTVTLSGYGTVGTANYSVNGNMLQISNSYSTYGGLFYDGTYYR